MNKKIIILIVLIVVIACLAVFIFGKNHGTSNHGGIGDNIIYSELPIISTLDNKTQKENITLDMEIPQISNLDASYCDYFNQKVKRDIDYEKIYNELSIMDNVKQKFNYETRYDSYRNGDFLSIVVTQISKYGDDQERREKKCYVVDAKNAKTAYLEDTAMEPYNYKYYILSRVNDAIFRDRIQLKTGERLTSISDTQAFYIKDGKMHIYFASGQIASESVGDLDFEMPFKFENGRFILE